MTKAHEWPMCGRVAVALAYDGALLSHLEIVLPVLDRYGFKGTFFITPPGVLENPQKWQEVVANGHEIADHTLFDATLDGALPRWTLEMVRGDLDMSRQFFAEVFPLVNPIAFAIPGSHPVCVEGSYLPELRRYTFLRGSLIGSNLLTANVRDLRSRPLQWGDPNEWRGPFEILVSSDVDPVLHESRIEYLAGQPDRFWVAPLSEIAGRLI